MMRQTPAVRQSGGEVAEFTHQAPKKRQAAAKSVMDYAKDIRDWPTLEIAVKEMMQDQAELVDWWDKYVTPNKGGDRKSTKQTPRPARLIPMPEAEGQTGIKHQQKSKWNRRLKEPDKYRAMLYGASYHKAMAEANTTATKWTGDPESYTPEKYIEAARTVMGGMLKAMPKHPAGRPAKNQLQTATNLPPTYAELEIEPTAAHRYQTMACYTQQEIAEAENVTHTTVQNILQEMEELPDVAKPAADHLTDFKPPIYNIWKQQEKTPGSSHFGNSEIRWVDNLLYLYTKPFDVVVDPFGGGGMRR